ncbi:TPA: hypothetical protein REY24_002269 [Klebsiella pneumoniae]|jgi:hypothetical protein|uniref:Uncharacterized protein n=2 Tax=Klebsiella pneumoniae TaxID=573 RepID=A0A4U8ZV43_KLEPN|nr:MULTISPECIES: hypothetical protein [Enterobacteriaceae]ELJ5783400.1 hypothetical protein [Klebsiella pneumoniae subsp. pneumoniae HS11286]DAW02687.1 MAG TPA: hypothetical protein [Caudoviricetes sp.]HBZ7768013.1 hypothetical protein [Klebsiella variicola subsp. variicola]ASC12940.1 hypothetical protein AM486_19800 [Klebsiella pneumoniae]AUH81018.1 hypothetical protein CYD98_20255 [Klebsiella pneumoniae]
MTITKRAILDLEAEINDILEEDCAEVKFTFHAAYERLNDPRNNPAISLNELEDVFKEFIKIHLTTLLGYPEGTTFTIKCNKTKLHFPCSVVHDLRYGKKWIVQSVVTVMRKADFKSKDPIILEIN